MKNMVKERLEILDSHCKKNKEFELMSLLAKELINELREYNIIEKIDMQPNCMLNGSIGIHITTMPKDIVLKLWHNSNMYYMSFFQTNSNFFDKQLKETFNDRGVMPIKDIDEAEERILDFLSNEICNRDTKSTLK